MGLVSPDDDGRTVGGSAAGNGHEIELCVQVRVVGVSVGILLCDGEADSAIHGIQFGATDDDRGRLVGDVDIDLSEAVLHVGADRWLSVELDVCVVAVLDIADLDGAVGSGEEVGRRVVRELDTHVLHRPDVDVAADVYLSVCLEPDCALVTKEDEFPEVRSADYTHRACLRLGVAVVVIGAGDGHVPGDGRQATEGDVSGGIGSELHV